MTDWHLDLSASPPRDDVPRYRQHGAESDQTKTKLRCYSASFVIKMNLCCIACTVYHYTL